MRRRARSVTGRDGTGAVHKFTSTAGSARMGTMSTHLALAAAASLLALAFAMCTLERWLDRRKPHEAAWTVALFLFAAASTSLWAGAAFGWNGLWFRLFYLFGAIVNVPYLALGTVYLLAERQVAQRVATAVH